MKSAVFELGEDDKKALALFQESLFVCAHNHVFSRMLLAHFATARGPMFAIIGDWHNLGEMVNYDYPISPPKGSTPFEAGFYPREQLVAFVKEHLRSAADAVVMSENWGASRKTTSIWLWPPPRFACFGDDEVYHFVTPDITDTDMIEASVLASHHWQTGVCSSCADVPDGEIPGEGFLEEIVRNTKHIFIPAFDGSGYLIWTPCLT